MTNIETAILESQAQKTYNVSDKAGMDGFGGNQCGLQWIQVLRPE